MNHNNIEYIKLFMEKESDDMPIIYFYEVDLNCDRFMIREIEVFADRTVKFDEIWNTGIYNGDLGTM